MAEVEDAMTAPTTTESEGATTDEEVHLSPTCVCRRGGGRIKLLCSFGGRIVPRPSDGVLKYIGGETRVLAVPRSIPFREMKKKVEEMFKTEVAAIKYQLLSHSEDLDILVSVTCDDDLVHMLDEYDALDMKRSPTAWPRFRAYIFAPQTTTTTSPRPVASPASARFAAGFSRRPHPHHYYQQHHHHHHFQPGERYVSTVPVTPSGGSPRYPSHGTVSAGNSPRASAMAAEPSVFEGLGQGMGGMQRVRSSPNLGSLVDADAAAQHLHHHAGDVGGFVSSSPRIAGAAPLFLQSGGGGHHHYQHQYAPQHPGRYAHRMGNYLAPPMVPVARPSDRPFSRGGAVPHGGEMQAPKKAALVWD